MRRSEDLTLIVSGSRDLAARRYRIPHALLYTLGVALLVLLSSFVLSTFHYYRMYMRTLEYERLKVEVDVLRKENETFGLSAKQLGERIASLELTSKKLQMLSGLDGEGRGGVGGPSLRELPLLSLDKRGLIRHFKSLERKRISLDGHLNQLREVYKTRHILLATTPAIMPVRGYPSGGYGYRVDPFSGQREFHPGIDISAPRGNKVTSTADGTVVFVQRKLGYGKLVRIRHRFGISTRYGHLERFTVQPGQTVRKGDIIGYVGSTGRATGPHLHYEVRLNGQPLNPLRFFRDSS